MLTALEQSAAEAAETAVPPESPGRATARSCFHCGEPCPTGSPARGERTFCCAGCLFVHDLLAESGLSRFYELNRHPGVRVSQAGPRERWAYLDAAGVRERLLDFTDGKLSRVTLRIPAIHCVACVWLLENLFQLHPGIGKSQVNFPRREVAISFRPQEIALSELVALLVSIGYEPQLTLEEIEPRRRRDPAQQRQWLQMGLAGFAFGNIMLISLPLYLGLDSLSGPLFRSLFGWLSLLLAAPVLVYSAGDYWRSAWLSFRQRALTLDVPIALGLAALYAQSGFEIISGRGEGYLDSLTGLVFFLLCGRLFQQKTHERIAFDRDYKCFFPLSVTRQTPAGEETVVLSDLRVGDRLRLRHGELIPADAKLIAGPAVIDYSFVTGESAPVSKQPGEYLYAGGKQLGGRLEVEIVKPVSQSYLTSLWDHATFRKAEGDDLNSLTNRYSRRFTRVVIGVALAAAAYWLIAGDASRGIKAFISVLIVACPCALALAAPFTLGTGRRLLARLQVFLKNPLVLERLAQVNAIVFDKTGTLTAAGAAAVTFHPAPGKGAGLGLGLSREEASLVAALAQQSTHPHALRIADTLREAEWTEPVTSYEEATGGGVRGTVAGRQVALGSRAWLESQGVSTGEDALPPGGVVALAMGGVYRGAFVLDQALRPAADRLIGELATGCELALLSGDNQREAARFRTLFGPKAALHFHQSPLNKLGFISALQAAGRTVMMVGDGLNDAGALKQSDVGVAVVERVGAFSPASDLILPANQVPRLSSILAFAKKSSTIVRVSFGISACYNVAGIGIAAAGILSPLICAILMPLSSFSVVLFACGATTWAARRAGLATAR